MQPIQKEVPLNNGFIYYPAWVIAVRIETFKQ